MGIAFFFNIITARPNPITDDDNDESKEAIYTYPEDFNKTSEPYWHAWSGESRKRLKEHDRLESLLMKIRHLDFKLREAWTPSEHPFIAT